MTCHGQAALGATYLGEGRCRFHVWAPKAKKVSVYIVSPRERLETLNRDERGYHYSIVEGIEPGTLYLYLLDGRKKRPDPASRHQPQGVHGPSQVVDSQEFLWSDSCWTGLPLDKLVFYELHVGTFTPEGTFEAVIPCLESLAELGVTAIELMPVAQFPGSRNWGYDGVYPFAVQNSYGGPDGLRLLVDACHRHGLAVYLDVVYNHLGPAGNYLGDYGPYFTDRYRTPWGPAVNFDGPYSGEVRRYFIENALHWISDYHIDGLRLDAVHAIMDRSARPFLEELGSAVHRLAERLGRRVYVIAESDLNDPRVILPRVLGGYGLDGQWCDDFHHALHALLTGERSGYYRDYGSFQELARSFREGYVYTGQYSAFRNRRHGDRPLLCRASQFVVFAQNHDQVGNRATGERLSALLDFDGLKLAAALVLLSPYLPLLFMGEEYGETAPFQYFTSHTDPKLADAIRKGRKKEFASFGRQEQVPDPGEESTFCRSKLNRDLSRKGPHRALRSFYRELLRLRREHPVLADLNRDDLEVTVLDREQVLCTRRWNSEGELYIIFCFQKAENGVTLPIPAGRWRKILDSAAERWLGAGDKIPETLISPGEVRLTTGPRCCVLFERV